MKIVLHKGSHEIGGTCIQLTAGKTSILLDAGLPLSAESQAVDMAKLSVDAVLISHSHKDHYGMMTRLPLQTPVYIGKLGKSFIDATKIFLGEDIQEREYRHFQAWKSFQIGDFTITPYLMDHSAADAYAFLIEAEGKRPFYSGDLRSHGRKAILFENLVKRPIRDIDLLFLEGTMLHRNNDLFPDETAVENTIFQTIRQQKNISFLLSSSQNIDRIVSAYRACIRAHKLLVIDIYTAWGLEQLRQVSQSTPTMDRPEIRVFASHRYNERLKANRNYFGDFKTDSIAKGSRSRNSAQLPNRSSTSARCPAFTSSINSRTPQPPSTSFTRSGSTISMESTLTTTAATKSPPTEATRQSTSSSPTPAGMRPLLICSGWLRP
jgi:ribonuclease J